MAGVLIAALVSEEEKKIIGGFQLDDGRTILSSFPISEAELQVYRRYPETYFGIYHSQGKRINGPLETYDFVYQAYKNTPKEKLLEFLREHPNYVELQHKNQEELAKIYSESMTYAFLNKMNNDKRGE